MTTKTTNVVALFPQPPDWLSEAGRDEWWLHAPKLAADGRLNDHTLSAFAILCGTSAQISEALQRGDDIDPLLIEVYMDMRRDFGLSVVRFGGASP